MKFCPDCGAKTGGSKFCPDCGRSLADQNGENNVIQRSTVETGGAMDDSVVSRSTVKTDRVAIKDAVISHSTITQTETHQHFGESVGTYETQMELGRTAFEGKNYDEAVDFFNTALKIDSRSFEPWFLKGLSCAELRRTDEAVTNLRRALRTSDGHRVRIVEEIKALVDRISKSAMVVEAQANDLLSKANVELQYSYQYKSGARAEKDGSKASALALDLFVMPGLGSSMRTTSAVEGLEKRQEADKREAEGKKFEDQAKDLLSNSIRLYNSAIRFCELVIEFNKEDEFSWMKRGEIFLRLKLYPDACRSYESVLSFNPYHREALRLRGMCFHAQGLPVPPPPGPKDAEPAPEPAAPAPPQRPPPGQQAIPMSQPAAPAPQQVQAPVQQRAPARQPAPSMPQRQTPAPQVPAAVAATIQPAAVSSRPQMARAPAPPAQAGIPGAAAAAPSAPVPRTAGQPQQQAPHSFQGAVGMAPQATCNPCPYCRGEMNFVKEKGVWFCNSCRRFSDRPAR